MNISYKNRFLLLLHIKLPRDMQWILILKKCCLEFFQPYVFHAKLAYHNFSTLFLIMVSLYTEQVFFVGFFFPKEQST